MGFMQVVMLNSFQYLVSRHSVLDTESYSHRILNQVQDDAKASVQDDAKASVQDDTTRQSLKKL
jgi:hypothetical protein